MHLECICAVWDPHYKESIDRLKRVQRFALKVCFGNWTGTYEDLSTCANIPALGTRRKMLKLSLLYSFLNGLALAT